MAKNNNLHTAKREKNDEFYTQLSDISKEVTNYFEFFKDKVVMCNCDDPIESNFTKFFILNFKKFGLKKLICTFYVKEKQASVFEYEGQDLNDDGVIDCKDIELISKSGVFRTQLRDDDGFDWNDVEKCWEKGIYGSGDFRSQNVIMYLKEADVVVTNPPFSLFREYVKQLMDYNKKFLIIGNNNAITYKDIFKYIKSNELWLGFSVNKTIKFKLSDDYEKWDEIDEEGNKYGKVPAITWFTNIPHSKRNQPLNMYKKYDPDKYPKYDNYDAIEVSKVAEIPEDYYGVMGVPITFLDKYCPKQFEIIGLGIANLGLECGVRPYKPHHKQYRKEVQHKGQVDGDLYMVDENDHPIVPYARILIKRIQN